MIKSILLAVVGVATALGQSAKPIIDNERVTVWDVTWTKGQTNPARGHDRDTVIMWLVGGKVRSASGPSDRVAGQAAFSPRGRKREQQGVEDGKPPRSLVIELKDHPVAPLPNKTKYPLAFPRPHAMKVLENDRVIVWSYRWNPGEPTPMHFHDKDVVVAYLEPTALTSTTPEGAKTLNQYKAFEVRFNQRDRTHTELLENGTGSAMMMELK